jgi:hydrogenase maturation protease
LTVIHLICLGNPLHADDGFGSAMGHRLRRLEWPGNIRVLDATGSKAPLPMFEQCRRAIVLESLPRHLGTPGQVLRLDGEEYAGHEPDPLTSGTGGLLSTVRRTVSPLPAIEVMGPVTCLRVPFAPGLSPLVMAATYSITAMLAAEFGGVSRRGRRGAA